MDVSLNRQELVEGLRWAGEGRTSIYLERFFTCPNKQRAVEEVVVKAHERNGLRWVKSVTRYVARNAELHYHELTRHGWRGCDGSLRGGHEERRDDMDAKTPTGLAHAGRGGRSMTNADQACHGRRSTLHPWEPGRFDMTGEG